MHWHKTVSQIRTVASCKKITEITIKRKPAIVKIKIFAQGVKNINSVI